MLGGDFVLAAALCKSGDGTIEPDGRIRPVATYYGLAEDEKPIEGVNDEENKEWLPWTK